MKFKDLDEKTIFTWWGSDHLHTGVKIGGDRVFCFDTLEIISIHANKDVKEPEPVSEDVILKFGHSGQAFLCSPLPGGKMFARRVLLIGGEIMHDNDLKSVSAPKAGEEQKDMSEVYITLFLLDKKIDDLGNVLKLVKTAISENLDMNTLDNRIMSTSKIKKLALTTE